MARIYGTSAGTKYLLNGLKGIPGRNITNLDGVQQFQDDFRNILIDTTIRAGKQHDDLIYRALDEESRLDRQLRDGLSRRTIEVDGKIARLDEKRRTAEHVATKLGYHVQFWFHTLTRLFQINRPFRQKKRNLSGVKDRKDLLIARKPLAIERERKKVIDAHLFLMARQDLFIGARREEEVIALLTRLPDEYHVFNDVNLRFPRAIYWKKRDEWIETSRIDHVVLGPTGIYVLEMKNWEMTDFVARSDTLEHRVSRSNYSLWYYLGEHYGERGILNIRNVIVSMHRSSPTGKVGKHIDVVPPHQLCDYITGRNRTLSPDAISTLVPLISGRISEK